jgi:hypothetical protein
MILVGAVLMSLRPYQIGTHDRLTAAKEALAAPTPMNGSPDPRERCQTTATGTLAARRAPGSPEGLAARQREETAVRPTYGNQIYERLMPHYMRRYEWNTA